VDPAALDELRESLRAAFGHHARFSHFPIHGLCARCARARSRA
jgi:Fur family ferric uptake transcriptional regulator